MSHGHLPTGDPYLPGHGDPSWRATRYDLDLDYDLVRNHLSGRATVGVELLEATDRVVLDLAGLKASKVTVAGRSPKKYAARGDRLVVTLRDEQPVGARFDVRVTYAGKPKPLVEKHHGDAGWEELTDGVIVAGQPHGAPTWFPCNDRPDDKAPYRISVTAPADYIVVANGTRTARTRGSGSVTWTYEQAEPMSTYLATVQIGRYDVRRLGTAGRVPVHAAVPADVGDGFEDAFGRNVEMLEVFTELFGPYPFPAYTAVVTDDDLEIPLESQSMATFGRNLCTGDWDSVRLVAHELAHQWFGNAVTLRRWSDIWLHEGFACYSEWLWSERSGGDAADVHARRHHERLSGLDQDLLLSDPGPELMFDDRVYKRGALTLHALRGTLGDDAFFDLLRAWVADHSGGTVETADFVAAAVEAAGDEQTRSAVVHLMEAWLHATALPDLA
ncbi:MAG: peptidase M1 [Nocardioides sp.]|nr:peptidase M1 [Nocardioides sp.]